MHDRRGEIRGRLRRIVDQHLRAAERRHVADLTVAAWPVPPAPDGTVGGEPVPFAQAVGQDFRPFAVGEAWGPAVGHDVVPGHRRGAGRPRHVELVVDLGFTAGQPGFQAEGLVYAPDGTHPEGHRAAATATSGCVGSGESVDLFVEAAANPDVGSEPSASARRRSGDQPTAPHDPHLRAAAQVELVHRDREVWELVQDVEVLDGLAARAAAATRAAPRSCAALDAGVDAVDPDDVPARPPQAAAPTLAAGARPPRAPAPTASSPSATRTSTRPGCGRCARRSASAPARSRTCST